MKTKKSCRPHLWLGQF